MGKAGKKIIKSLEEAVDFAKGKKTGAVLHTAESLKRKAFVQTIKKSDLSKLDLYIEKTVSLLNEIKVDQPHVTLNRKFVEILEYVGIATEHHLYLQNVEHALSLIWGKCWYHISHLDVGICPTIMDPNVPISSAVDYYPKAPKNSFGMGEAGRPIEYTAMFMGPTPNFLARSICAAYLTYIQVLLVRRKAVRDEIILPIFTGMRHLLAMPDYTLAYPKSQFTGPNSLIPDDSNVE